MQANGTETLEQVPLTLEDVLHPREEDCIPEHPDHERDRRYLHDVFETRLIDDPTAVTFSDCLIAWGVRGLRPHSPDISVFFGAKRKYRRFKGTFYVKRERARPVLAIEITSPDTRSNDLSIKVEHYHLAHVPVYIIVDRKREDGPPRLLGYRYREAHYVRMAPDQRGRLLLKQLGVRIGVRENRVVCYDAVTDEEIGDYAAMSEALDAETKARKKAEQREQGETKSRRAAEKRASAAEARLRELEDRLRRLEGESESPSA
jgi:Uma2 family endonuclease